MHEKVAIGLNAVGAFQLSLPEVWWWPLTSSRAIRFWKCRRRPLRSCLRQPRSSGTMRESGTTCRPQSFPRSQPAVQWRRFRSGVAKLRPADQFNAARQTLCTFFSSTTFPTVDSSATALGAACIKQKCKQMVWFYCYYCSTIHFNNLFLHRLRQSHCIRPSSGEAVANLALGSKILATPGSDCHLRYLKPGKRKNPSCGVTFTASLARGYLNLWQWPKITDNSKSYI